MFGQTKRSRSNSVETTRFSGVATWRLPRQPVLVWITDGILVALAVVFPFIMGGREAWGHRTLITLAMALGFVWSLHRIRTGGRLILTAIEPLVIVGLLLVWFQTLPVSPNVLATLSGEYERLLPVWQNAEAADATFFPWKTASLYPSETQHAFFMLLAYGVIAVVLAQRLATEKDCYLVLKLVGISGLLMAVFSVLQLVMSNDRFFWFYRHPFTGTREVLKGAFTNRNHFAQFLSLSIGPLIWWMLADRLPAESAQSLRRRSIGAAHGNHSNFGRFVDPKMLLLICATGGIVLAIMLSLSRGGMISGGLACCVSLAGIWKCGRVRASLAFVMLALALIAIGGIALSGNESVEERVGQLASGDADKIDRLNARRSIWKADIAAIQAFPVTGTGVGSHRFVYPVYMDDLASFLDVTFSHAESTYIHLALETGLLGLGLLLLGLFFLLGRILWNLIRKQESDRVAALAAIAASLLGGAVHAAVDFIWYAPAIVVTSIMLGIAGLRLCSGFHGDEGVRVSRIGWLVGGICCLFVLCRVQPDLAQRVIGERLWFQYLNAEFDASGSSESINSADAGADDLETALSGSEDIARQSPESIDASQFENPADYRNEETNSVTNHAREWSLRDRIQLLMASLRIHPDQAEASLHLASRCLELFELLQQENDNRLSLPQIRDVVVSSNFDSSSQMHAFLKRAFGSNMKLVLLARQSSHRSLHLSPLSSKAYETLLATEFSRDPHDLLHDRLINQALLVGDHSPRTRYAMGLTFLQEGRQTEAMEQWEKVFHLSRQLRLSICRTLGKTHPVDLILVHFNPSADEMPEVLKAFLETGRQSDLQKIGHRVSEIISTSTAATVADSEAGSESHLTLLMDLSSALYRFRDLDHCEELLQLAIACDPEAEPPRRALGLLMLEQKRYLEADVCFAWCSEQLPGDTKLENLRRECRRMATNQEMRVRAASYQR